MRKILAVAWREFASTAITKAFIIGAFVIPGVMIATIPDIIMLVAGAKGPRVVGEVGIIDHTGEIAARIEAELSVERVAERRGDIQKRVQEELGKLGMGGGDAGAAAAAQAAIMAEIPEYHPVVLPPDADAEAEQKLLHEKDANRLALAVVAPDAVRRAPDAERFGAYQLFVRPGLDDRNRDDLRAALRRAILDARYEANGVVKSELEALVSLDNAETREVTASGEERSSTEELKAMLPLGFIILLMMSVMIGGQYLLTTTVEEKSSRVVEILLAAVSPIELMTGKIIGQMCVGLLLLFIYTGMGVGTLSFFSLTDLIAPWQLACLFMFFILAYFMIASFMAAIGAAVNELREAQSLMGPVMIVVMLPYILWMPISRDPNSTLSLVLSLIPPMSPFAMMMRMTSSDPPPMWQVLLALGLNALAAYLSVWAAGKVFRIGLLMYGKPPNFRTLLRWIRMA